MDKLNLDINQFLRFLLAGGWGLVCYFFISPDNFEKFITGNSIDLIVIALVMGSMIYVIHRAVIYPNIYKIICFILWIFRKKGWDRGILIPFFPSTQEIEDDFRRWNERQNEKSTSSKYIVEWGSQVHFLYCSAFASLVAILLSNQTENAICSREQQVYYLFLFLVSAGLINHIRLVLYDLKATDRKK